MNRTPLLLGAMVAWVMSLVGHIVSDMDVALGFAQAGFLLFVLAMSVKKEG